MATTTRCPNTSCGCVSQLVERSAGPDFPMSSLPDETADRTRGRGGLGLDGDHPAVVASRRRLAGWQLPDEPGHRPGPDDPGRSGGRLRRLGRRSLGVGE